MCYRDPVQLSFAKGTISVQGKHTKRLKASLRATRPPLPKELSPRGSHFDEAAGQPFSLHHGRHGGQPVALHQAARHARRRRALARGDDDAQPVVPAAPHGTAASVHHETHQEAAKSGQTVRPRAHRRLPRLRPTYVQTYVNRALAQEVQ